MQLNIEKSKYSNSNDTVHFALRLKLNEPLSTIREVFDFIQDNYFDDLGSNGFFKVQGHSLVCTGEEAQIDICLMQYLEGISLSEELKCTTAELNAFVAAPFATHWEQLDIHAELMKGSYSMVEGLNEAA